MAKGQGRRGGKGSTKPKPATKAKAKAPIVQTEKSRCIKCRSTERTEYKSIVRRRIPGRDSNGDEYTHVCWARTKCRNCGQHRVDRFYENRIEADSRDE